MLKMCVTFLANDIPGKINNQRTDKGRLRKYGNSVKDILFPMHYFYFYEPQKIGWTKGNMITITGLFCNL